jgi:hypothetical protein
VAGTTIVASAMNTRFTGIETWAKGTPDLSTSGSMTTVKGTLNVDEAVTFDSSLTMTGALTVGVDGTGHDVKFYGDTASAYMEWDQSADDLILGGVATLVLPDGSASAPVITNSGDTNTGIYFSAADEVSITTAGTQRFTIEDDGLIKSPRSYSAITGETANLTVLSDGRFYRHTSSIRFKTDVETLDNDTADNILNLRPVTYKSLGIADNPESTYLGFVAEEVEGVEPRLVSYSLDGQADGVQYERVIPALVNVIKRQEARIAALEA